MSELFQQIPGLEAVVEREAAVRNQSFLDDLPEVICGIEVKPLTLRMVLLLECIGSPFIGGGIVQPHDIGAFLIVVAGNPKGFRRWRLLRRVGKMNANHAVVEIESYVSESFMDRPGSSGSSGASYYSNAAAFVDLFASEYGWSTERVLNAPLKQLFQCLKATAKRHNPKAILFNKLSGKVICRHLEKVTAENQSRN